MKFKNKPNTLHTTTEGKTIWKSRSVAVVGCVLVNTQDGTYVLSGKRGDGTPDYQGYWNVPCGYLDWNENGYEAIIREVYEETGLDLTKYVQTYNMVVGNLNQPWLVNTEVDENQQNVSLRYGCVLRLKSLPELNSNNSEPGEVSDLCWINIDDIDYYDWAFNHGNLVKEYFNKFALSILI